MKFPFDDEVSKTMTINQQLLIFRTCLAVLVILKKLAQANPNIAQKKGDNLQSLIKSVNDEVNRLYVAADEYQR